ncbi:iron-sulfur cluster repair di-iron protein [Halalkalibacter krulwichiae]|uniref:Iron-sulfur cluster repair protein YtfE n=1 Tax=Halalkalibacter krulwichiae TaxID=199441 RepID=A0A1X9MAH2_9BACI|nr:iron-sulfur cluster repair di-iron protein [Halalkalibacter krulwichiae]ARK30426.1 Iron-sulfur cluster repair protein YtfE [Halalkalibacter krulwichiae]
MEQVFFRTTKTGDIVTKFPKASQVLKEYKIDFCCGGNQPISEAIKDRHLNEEEVLNKLNSLYSEAYSSNESINWREASYPTLINYIITTHHVYLNETLPELAKFVTKVYRVHGKKRKELKDVYHLFHQLKLELEHHLIEEEERVFPNIIDYESSRAQTKLNATLKTISELEDEHESAGTLLKELRQITNDYSLPEGACTTYTLMYLKLQELEADLFEHIHLENNILFPRLEQEASNE